MKAVLGQFAIVLVIFALNQRLSIILYMPTQKRPEEFVWYWIIMLVIQAQE